MTSLTPFENLLYIFAHGCIHELFIIFHHYANSFSNYSHPTAITLQWLELHNVFWINSKNKKRNTTHTSTAWETKISINEK